MTSNPQWLTKALLSIIRFSRSLAVSLKLLYNKKNSTNNLFLGGSFGVVYKGIEKATGETVAIKHVSPSIITAVARSTS